MKNRLQFLLRKNAGKQYLEIYQEEVSKLVIGKDIKVMSLEESDMILKMISDNMLFEQSNLAWSAKQIPFQDKHILKKIISDIRLKYGDIVYMQIKNSDICGLALLDRIDMFNVSFHYEDDSSGLITFYDKSLTNMLVVDFYEEWNEYSYDIEIYGKQWSYLVL